jgi:TolB-like protein/Tfp pilus assembly protein PilF
MNPGNFFTELKRRNVYRAAVAYGVVAWFLTQLTTQVFPFFDIPNQAIRFVVIALALGFPIAMSLAWIYEFTPEGIVRSEDLDPAGVRAARRTTGRILDFIIIGVLVLVIAMLLYQRISPRSETGETISQKSIAVLPFENLSSDKENAFFTDGMQDEVLTDLARIADLKVISRGSVMQYKTTVARNLREIAGQLRVVYLLEGSVQRSGGKVRVNAQLIDARNDSHVWAKTFDRSLEDVFAVQSDIAQTIAQQLHAQISPQTRAVIEEKATNDMVAYDLYLQTLQLWHNIATSKDWEGDTRKGIDLLDRAAGRDPHFGLAYGLLTELNLNLYDWVDHSTTRAQRARDAMEQALALAPQAAETFVARSWVYSSVEHDYDAALEMLKRAAELLPGDSDILNRLAARQLNRGQWEEAVRNLERARELDPRGPNVPNHLKEIYLGLRQYAKCDQLCDQAIASFPNGPGYFLAAKVESARARGDIRLARERLAAVPKEWDPSSYRSLLAVQVAVADRKYDEAQQLFASLDRKKVIAAFETDFALLEALVARAQGDTARSNFILLPLREAKAKELGEHPNESVVFSEAGMVDAYLGHKEDAIREAEKAIELRPISRDAVNGPARLTDLALVCALTGEHNRAIQLLEQVAAIPYGPSYGELLMPTWDDLRTDPRFEKVVASLKPKNAE